MNPRLKEWTDAVLGFFYPDNCQLCRRERATSDEGYVCAQCWHGVRFVRPPFCDRCGLPFAGEITTKFECSNCREMDLHFESARAAVIANALTLDVIHRYKYGRALWFEPFLADLLCREAAPVLRGGEWDLIVPVPLHPLKQREREFNQAARLGDRLSRRTGIPLNTSLLSRRLNTRTQTQLTRAERAANMRAAFATRPGVALRGERIVLVDDVLTTGATTSACARVLVQAGAGKVSVWTLARGV
ncbi:MAG TPA: ComF family protein [Verrucomicrobiae bacterium]|jgi:ComF family protein